VAEGRLLVYQLSKASYPSTKVFVIIELISLKITAHYLPVIHMILTDEAGTTEIPMILDGKAPPATDPPNIGSRDYSKQPVAVLAGRGYDLDTVKTFQEACKGKRGIRWLTADQSVPIPEQAPLGTPEHADHIAGRMKAKLDELAAKGELQGEGNHLY
jgi:hypothetical protein